MLHRYVCVGSTLLSAALAAACANDSSDMPTVAVIDCGRLKACDITQTTCQRAILTLTACVREDDAPELPPINTMSRAQYAQSLTDKAASAGTVSSPDFDAALQALHLLSGTSTTTQAVIDEQAAQVVAFYSAETKDVTIISDNAPTDPDSAMNVLAHEFTHYLQDQHEQLGNKKFSSTDLRTAWVALVESEAVVTSYRASAQMLGAAPQEVRWSAVFQAQQSDVASAVNASASPLLAATDELPYVLASPYIEQLWEDDGRAPVDSLFGHPPRQAADWLGMPAETAVPALEEPLDCYPPLAPSGFGLVGWDRFGVAGVYGMLGAAKAASLSAAGHVRGDALAFYTQMDAAAGTSVLAVWRVRFDSQSAAQAFVSSIAGLDLQVTQFGVEVAISVSAGSAGEPLAGDALTGCPSPEQLDASVQARAPSMASLIGWRH